MVYVLIKDGKVMNTIKADQAFIDKISADYDDIILLDDLPEGSFVSRGDTYSGGEIIKKEKPVKEDKTVKLKEGKAALLEAKKFEDLVPILQDILDRLVELSE